MDKILINLGVAYCLSTFIMVVFPKAKKEDKERQNSKEFAYKFSIILFLATLLSSIVLMYLG